MINLKELEQSFIDKIETKKKILHALKVRTNRVDTLKHKCLVRLHFRGSNRFLESLLEEYNEELRRLSYSRYHMYQDIDSCSATVCRLREKRRGKSKQSLEQILIKAVL